MANTASFTFENSQWEDYIKKIQKKWKDIQTRKKFGGIISAAFFSDYDDHFKSEQGPDGKWQAWSKVYAQHMARIGKSGRGILKDSGRLRMGGIVGKEIKYRPNSAGVILYNNAQTKGGFPYAYAHDNDDAARTRLPRRSFMWLSSKGMDAIINQTERWLAEE